MKNDEIWEHMNGSALATSLREGSIENLMAFQAELKERIRERRRIQWRTYGYFFLFAVIFAAGIALILRLTLLNMLFCHIAAQAVAVILWYFFVGIHFRDMRIMEKILKALVSTIIAEKSA